MVIYQENHKTRLWKRLYTKKTFNSTYVSMLLIAIPYETNESTHHLNVPSRESNETLR